MKFKPFIKYSTGAVTAVVLCLLASRGANAEVQVTVNGSVVDIAPPPIVDAGRVFVPLRGVFEQLGASVVYSNGTINATGNGRNISLAIGSTQATVNGQPQTIDVAPFIVGASTYVPLRFISEALGDSVSWDDAQSIAAIDTGGGSATYFSPGTASYVDTPPPPIPVYEQPYVPEPNVVWQPGYWAWGSYGYYWVPGAWVAAPQPGYLWTPGYWQSNNAGYSWNPGYWALAVGFYGGVNYGGGYFGQGYDGGQWSNNVFRYNTFVSRVNTANVRNVYVDRNVYVNNAPTRISYNGGRGGLGARPTSAQLAVARERHIGMTAEQRQHVTTAESDRRLLATVNHDKPPVLAVARPLSATKRPAGFVPVKTSDRVNPLANVVPAHVPPAHAGRPAGRTAAHAPGASAGHVPAVRTAPAPHVPAAAAAHVPAAHTAPDLHAPAAAAAHVPAARTAPEVHAPAAAAVHVPAGNTVVEPHAPGAAAAHVPGARAVPEAHIPAASAPHVPAVYAAPPAHVPAVHPAPAAAVHEAPQAHVPAVHAVPAPAAPAAQVRPHEPKAHAGEPHADASKAP